LDLVLELAEHSNIVSVKEAAGDVDRVSHYVQHSTLDVLSGDDALTLPKMAVGAVGVVSVASNVAPHGISEMVRAAREGRWADAQALHQKYHPLFCDLFMETNPIPVKAALAMMGRVEEVYRLPLCSMRREKKGQLRTTMQEVGLL
jgi:4-hydroxy-tetrahydrodipicolinate synthase